MNRGTLRERKTAAKEIIASLTEKLQLGWNPMLSAFAPEGSAPAFDVFDAFESVNLQIMTQK